MIQNKIAQLILLPFSFLYGIAISLRNLMYDSGMLRSTRFSIPVISVGNLSIGGTGKTPHIEYLIRLLSQYVNIATLSRGYKRKSKGFLFVKRSNSVHEVGDEALVYRRKYADIVVAVSESREIGIPQILQNYPQTQLILLDDAFQHRSVTPGLNILLTEYDRPFAKDFLLPAGRLREWRASYKRADMIIVTKCPDHLSTEDRDQMIQLLQPQNHQKVFFSYYRYQPAYYLFNGSQRKKLDSDLQVLLVSAIAHTDYLYSYLEDQVLDIVSAKFEDHHYFSHHDMSQLKIAYDRMGHTNKIILTTEKDAVRFAEHKDFIVENDLPFYILPIDIQFHFDNNIVFNDWIKQFLLNFKV